MAEVLKDFIDKATMDRRTAQKKAGGSVNLNTAIQRSLRKTLADGGDYSKKEGSKLRKSMKSGY